MSHQEYAAIGQSVDTESCPTDDESELEDPSFDLLEKDKKSFETVQRIIEVGQVETLKLEQCKVYLRKHELRLTGKKDILLQRIREHLSIMNGEGEKNYPALSFVMNCKGDACTGDVVMFEQNVYEMFNIASRSSSGPPCGKRLVVGRIVKESYGAAKQQHTFTIEVLWSKGEKPLPPLHPLLIKGRNLYKLNTMRQRWEDEGERQKSLFEKHTRGSLARSSREARIQEKEMRKTPRENRALKTKDQNGNLEANKIKESICPPKPGFLVWQPNVEQVSQKTVQEQTCRQTKLLRPCNESNSVPTVAQQRVPTVLPPTGINYKENISSNLSKGLLKQPVDSQRQQFNPSTCAFRRAPLDEQSTNIPRSSFGGPIGQQQMTVAQQRVPTVLPPTGINYKENISSNLSKGLLKQPVDSQRQQFNPSTCAFRRAPLDEHSKNIPRSSFGGPIGQQQMTVAQQRVPTVLPPTGINYKENISVNLSKGLLMKPIDSQRQQFNPSTCAFRRAPLAEHSTNIPRSSFGGPIGQQHMPFNAPMCPLRMSSQDEQQRTNPTSPLRMSSQYQQQSSFGGPIGQQQMTFNAPMCPLRMSSQDQQQRTNPTSVNYTGSQFQGWYAQEGRASSTNFQSLLPRMNFQERNNDHVTSYGFQSLGHEQKQLCKYYAQGWCCHGDHCKYLH